MKTAYITGTTSGIGEALARELLANGWQVVGIARRSARLQHTAYHHIALDLSTASATELEAIFSGKPQAKQLVLVNNAGTLGQVAYAGKLSAEELDKVYRLNLTAPAILCNAFLAAYPQQSKVILNISSGAASYPVDGWSTYCSSKAGLQMLSEVLALEADKRKDESLRVFSVAPGVVDTEMQAHIRTTAPEDFSRVAHFKSLKEENHLTAATEVAVKLHRLLEKPEQFSAVQQDVRQW